PVRTRTIHHIHNHLPVTHHRDRLMHHHLVSYLFAMHFLFQNRIESFFTIKAFFWFAMHFLFQNGKGMDPT
ncbi:MAG: hypothetical protein LUQ37_02925, partial [Methanoregulaceae archaeon]|nr:hypothetical protein [Methanoregulaceae archaeon]